jgi:hypothetical protein
MPAILVEAVLCVDTGTWRSKNCAIRHGVTFHVKIFKEDQKCSVSGYTNILFEQTLFRKYTGIRVSEFI